MTVLSKIELLALFEKLCGFDLRWDVGRIGPWSGIFESCHFKIPLTFGPSRSYIHLQEPRSPHYFRRLPNKYSDKFQHSVILDTDIRHSIIPKFIFCSFRNSFKKITSIHYYITPLHGPWQKWFDKTLVMPRAKLTSARGRVFH